LASICSPLSAPTAPVAPRAKFRIARIARDSCTLVRRRRSGSAQSSVSLRALRQLTTKEPSWSDNSKEGRGERRTEVAFVCFLVTNKAAHLAGVCALVTLSRCVRCFP
jgi:hypothetical protein